MNIFSKEMNLFFDYYLGLQLLCITALDHVPFKVTEIPAYNLEA